MLAQEISHGRFIGCNDLFAIQWVTTASPGGLSDREMSLFQLLLSAIRMNPGSNTIRCTVAHLARAQELAHLRSHCSESTTRRALASLEAKGYLHRKRCRLGSASSGLELVLSLERWAYWTRRRVGNVSPIPSPQPVLSHTNPHQSNRPGEDRTRTNTGVNSCNLDKNRNNMHKGGSKNYRFHPIVFTLWCYLTKTKALDRRALVDRADLEIRAAAAGVVIANHTGIPWEQYSVQWRDMLPPVRESFAGSQIVPLLRGALPVGDRSSGHPVPPPELEDSSPASSEEIRELIRLSLSPSRSSGGAREVDTAPENTEGSKLSVSELELLSRARDRDRSRGIDDT